MRSRDVTKVALAGVLCAAAVAGSAFSVPVFGSRCAPAQHLANVLAAVFLGPLWGVAAAFGASLIRNLLGLGSLLAFPGSMFGALLAGIAYARVKHIGAALIGEVFGTAVVGGLCAYPIAVLFMGKAAGEIAFYAYVFPFFVSTAGGSLLAWLVLAAIGRALRASGREMGSLK